MHPLSPSNALSRRRGSLSTARAPTRAASPNPACHHTAGPRVCLGIVGGACEKYGSSAARLSARPGTSAAMAPIFRTFVAPTTSMPYQFLTPRRHLVRRAMRPSSGGRPEAPWARLHASAVACRPRTANGTRHAAARAGCRRYDALVSIHHLRASDHPPSQPFCLDLSSQGMRKIRDRLSWPWHGPDRSDPARAPHQPVCSRARSLARCPRSDPARRRTTAHAHPPTEASRAADGAREWSALRVDPPGLAGRAGRRAAAPRAAVCTRLLGPPSADFAWTVTDRV